MTASIVLAAVAASASVLVAGWRWQPAPERCRRLRNGVASPTGAARPRRTPLRSPWQASRRRPRGDQSPAIAGWCTAVAAAVRSGRALAVAIADVDPPAPLVDAVRSTMRMVHRGESLAESLRRFPPIDADARFAWVVVTAVAGHGGPAAEPLDRAAAALRARHAERVERQTQSTAARLSARVLTALPVVMLLALVTTSSAVRAAVLTPVGAVVIAAGSGLNAAGWLWMRRLLDRAAR